MFEKERCFYDKRVATLCQENAGKDRNGIIRTTIADMRSDAVLYASYLAQ
jgi:hypothetical protein